MAGGYASSLDPKLHSLIYSIEVQYVRTYKSPRTPDPSKYYNHEAIHITTLVSSLKAFVNTAPPGGVSAHSTFAPLRLKMKEVGLLFRRVQYHNNTGLLYGIQIRR